MLFTGTDKGSISSSSTQVTPQPLEWKLDSKLVTETLTPGLGWLSPPPSHSPRQPSSEKGQGQERYPENQWLFLRFRKSFQCPVDVKLGVHWTGECGVLLW